MATRLEIWENHLKYSARDEYTGKVHCCDCPYGVADTYECLAIDVVREFEEERVYECSKM